MKTLTISRKRWLPAKDLKRESSNGVLYRYDGKMCCLGFLARQCGAKVKDIVPNVAMPSRIYKGLGLVWPDGLLLTSADGRLMDSALADQLARINDDPTLTQRSRERKIKVEFKEIGIAVKFVP
jgi:hypothetical protein